ncbi:MAG TPA: hypothetical protein VFQ23_07045 [Anaerolineales bacterium]|nr:hypothetical protein [Anaerolineales bacterium]
MTENSSLPNATKPVWQTKRFLFLLSICAGILTIGAVGMYAWYFWVNPCDPDRVERAATTLISQLNWYDSAYQFATSSSKTALTRPVQVLQEIAMDTNDLRVPACMQTTKAELVNYMRTVVRAFQAYMRSETDATVRGILDESSIHFNNFTTRLEAIRECAPYCAPWD